MEGWHLAIRGSLVARFGEGVEEGRGRGKRENRN
jgi:hypothetical protein